MITDDEMFDLISKAPVYDHQEMFKLYKKAYFLNNSDPITGVYCYYTLYVFLYFGGYAPIWIQDDNWDEYDLNKDMRMRGVTNEIIVKFNHHPKASIQSITLDMSMMEVNIDDYI